jgi:PAS domain S-box-containing protein
MPRRDSRITLKGTVGNMNHTSAEASLLSENEDLRKRLIEAEEILQAIRNGEIDALLVGGSAGEQVYTLKGANQPYRILIETMNEGALTLSSEGTILYCNSRFSEMVNLQSERIMGHSFFEFVTADDRERIRELLDRGLKGRAKQEAHLESIDGDLLPALFSLRSLPFEDRHLICLVVTDLSDQKRDQEKLRNYSTVLEQKNKELQDFAFVASHDLQEPLRKIQAFGDLLAGTCGEAVGENGRDYLRRMEGAVIRMRALIEALLAYSRLTTQASPFSPVSLQDTAEEALSNLDLLVQEKGGRVEIDPLPTIEADPQQMLQLFQNLIGNALKFNRDGIPPVVRIRAELLEKPGATGTEAGSCRIEVKDNGIGFEEKYFDRIFSPFQRLHGRGKYAGTGIGLAICKRVVEHHGGEIKVKSTPGEGSTFIIKLPMKQIRRE